MAPGQAVGGGGEVGGVRFVRWLGIGNEQDLIIPAGFADRLGAFQVSPVDWIEAAAKTEYWHKVRPITVALSMTRKLVGASIDGNDFAGSRHLHSLTLDFRAVRLEVAAAGVQRFKTIV